MVYDTLPVAVHDRIQSMGNSQHRALGKLVSDRLLNEFVCLEVHRSSGFVENEDLCLAQERSCQTNQLSLSNTTMKCSSARQSFKPHIETCQYTIVLLMTSSLVQSSTILSHARLVTYLAARQLRHSSCALCTADCSWDAIRSAWEHLIGWK